jgi:hypothetical protein
LNDRQFTMTIARLAHQSEKSTARPAPQETKR